MSVRVEFRWEKGLLERVDGALGPGQPRADFVRRAVERELVRVGSERGALLAAHAIVERPEGYSEVAVGTAREAVEQTSEVLEARARSGRALSAAPASAEQPYRQHVPGPNVESIRSSGQAKRGVGPVPKGGS